MSHTHWGNETTAYGTSKFEAKLGVGDNVKVSRITGHVSASPQTDKLPWPSLWGGGNIRMRQALVIVGHFGSPAPASTTRIISGERTNNQVDGQSYFMVNPKVFGHSQVIVPFDYKFDPPVIAPGGRISLQIDNEGPGALGYDKDTLNVEVHQTIQWEKA